MTDVAGNVVYAQAGLELDTLAADAGQRAELKRAISERGQLPKQLRKTRRPQLMHNNSAWSNLMSV